MRWETFFRRILKFFLLVQLKFWDKFCWLNRCRRTIYHHQDNDLGTGETKSVQIWKHNRSPLPRFLYDSNWRDWKNWYRKAYLSVINADLLKYCSWGQTVNENHFRGLDWVQETFFRFFIRQKDNVLIFIFLLKNIRISNLLEALRDGPKMTSPRGGGRELKIN